MKFYLTEISEGDADIAGKAIYEYATLKEAVAVFHTKLGAAMKSSKFTSELVYITNSDGGFYQEYNEKYVAEETVEV